MQIKVLTERSGEIGNDDVVVHYRRNAHKPRSIVANAGVVS